MGITKVYRQGVNTQISAVESSALQQPGWRLGPRVNCGGEQSRWGAAAIVHEEADEGPGCRGGERVFM